MTEIIKEYTFQKQSFEMTQSNSKNDEKTHSDESNVSGDTIKFQNFKVVLVRNFIITKSKRITQQ